MRFHRCTARFRAPCGEDFIPGRPQGCGSDRACHQRRACSIVAGAADGPALRPASGCRLATSTEQRRETWAGIESVDDGELWETHLSLKAQLLEFMRRRARNRPSATRNPPKLCRDWENSLAGRADHRLRAPLCHLQARQPAARRYRDAGAMVNDAKRPVQFVFAGKAHPHDEPGKRVLQQIAQMMRDKKFAQQVRLCRGLRHQRRPPFGAGRRCVAQQSAPSS
jgi:hypothetical protein